MRVYVFHEISPVRTGAPAISSHRTRAKMPFLSLPVRETRASVRIPA